jgi:DNA polymerase I-like protein with 3'-5' exonuclease and polymerase domains
MKYAVVDIEANGLWYEATKIHCMCFITVTGDSIEEKSFGPDEVEQGIDYLNVLFRTDYKVVGHNIIDYDLKLIEKLYGLNYYKYIDQVVDTLLLSYILHPHLERHPMCPPSKVVGDTRRTIGRHSLENWGYHLWCGKVEHEDWETFSPEMLERCKGDVELTHKLLKRLIKDQDGDKCPQRDFIEKRFRYILSEQEQTGWLFDIEKAKRYVTKLSDDIAELEVIIMAEVPLQVVRNAVPVTKLKKKDGDFTAYLTRWYDNLTYVQFLLSDVEGEFCRVSFEPINLDSQSQVKDYLLSIGWVPTEWNYKKNSKGKFEKGPDNKYIPTSPKITEDSFKSLGDSSIGKNIAKRFVLRHRRSQIEGWLERVRDDGRLPAGGNSNGTNTGRVCHRTVVNVPKAEDGVFFGKEMRSLFTVPEGKVLIGADLDALENRVAAHYTSKYDGGLYADELLSGDPHTKVADLLGCERSTAKNISYAIQYGAQWPKIQEMLGCNEAKAKWAYKKWWEARESLNQLKDNIEKCLLHRGEAKGKTLSDDAYIRGIDGRRIFVRSWHSLMNALIQNAGSLVNKLTTIYIYDIIKDMEGVHFVGNFHDEVQIEAPKDRVEELKKLIPECMSRAGKELGLTIPITGEVQVGNNWSATH